MCTVDELVKHMSMALNDHEPGHEYKRWCKSLLVGYLQNAISVVASTDKAGFTKEKTVTLEAGCYHCVCDDCDDVVAVMSVGGNGCDESEEASKKYSGITKHYSRHCSGSFAGEDEEGVRAGVVELQKETRCCFKTERPVPAGTIARIMCYSEPDLGSIDSTAALSSAVCGRLRGRILELAMAQARLLDSESEAGIAASGAHLNVASAMTITEKAK